MNQKKCLNEWRIHNVIYGHRGKHMMSRHKHENLYQFDHEIVMFSFWNVQYIVIHVVQDVIHGSLQMS
jgi:hypothetical protein